MGRQAAIENCISNLGYKPTSDLFVDPGLEPDFFARIGGQTGAQVFCLFLGSR